MCHTAESRAGIVSAGPQLQAQLAAGRCADVEPLGSFYALACAASAEQRALPEGSVSQTSHTPTPDGQHQPLDGAALHH